MRRDYLNIMLILCLVLMFSVALTTIGRPDLNLSTADDITDSADDIVELNDVNKSWTPTDLHQEIDIDTMIHSGQNFTITLHETIPTTSDYTHYLYIYEDITDRTTMYTVLLYTTFSGYFMNPDGQFWTDSGWSSTTYGIVTVGTISGNEFEISIPSSALALQSSHNWFFISWYSGANNISYVDICPDSIQNLVLKDYSGPSDDGISGYELQVLIGIIAMFSIILISIYKKRIMN